MRRRLGRFLPIVMFAMLVQIFAPVAACLAFNPATADPLVGAICSHASDPSSQQDRENDPQQMHGTCALCCVIQAAVPPTDPQAFAVGIERDATAVIWRGTVFGPPLFPVDANAQARAPPSIS
ncbi:DUF2946 domain-containing protein [Nitrobacter winogradskyi]|uniref:Uncharacterized protein n=2 Tax=Nitrobacter winogradskyi TaxID=913 RepID=A0ACC6AJC2_NITWI|nr:DUF2946 domain-containing protein [Nitrobacter winogradskyi]MCP1999952.1 hypothetical protein [Nitrobacter winogradskyi]GEC16280.1 hypothetical protein NWI01_21720 [Nitrobacter winogradskyi]